MYFVKQSVQDDSSSLLDVNAMSAVPEYPGDPDRKVNDSLSLNLCGRVSQQSSDNMYNRTLQCGEKTE